jgi:hypothetical protein
VLTPKSPSHRAASLGGRRNLTFHATHAQPQSLTAPEHRIYKPGRADVPFLPPLTALPGLQAAELWPNQGRPQPGPGDPGPGASSIATTQTASPSASHTSQSQTEHTSPAFRYGAMPTSQQQFGSLRKQPPGPTVGHPADPGLRGHPESYQAGQPAYQIMLETDQGPMVVPVELDLQQASKMADEKKKRNAEASARFRARRREKEKEASQTISALQQELQELREERDFYRNERNYIRDFATRHVGVQLPPRQPSPQVQRCGRARSDSAPAAQRRTTSDYQPHFTGTTQMSLISHPFGTGYGPAPGLPLPPPPQGQGQATGPYASPQSLPPGPPAPPAAGLRSQSSYDPFHKAPFDRNWIPAR